MRRTTAKGWIGALAALVFAFSSVMASEDEEIPDSVAVTPESTDPIKLPMWEWTGHHVTQMLAGEILKTMGYNVEYPHVGEHPSIPLITSGELAGSIEYWVSTNRVKFYKATQLQGGEDMGYLGLAPGQAWYYPSYVEEQCPGLPDWTALNDCAELFASDETFPNGRFLDYPAEWLLYNQERIDALGLDYTPVRSSGEGSLITEIESAYARKAPLLVMFWSPHWIFSKFDLKPIKFPTHEVECQTDPSWGINPDAIYDCGTPVEEIKKLMWGGIREKWPAAYRLIRNFTLDNDAQNAMVMKIDVDGEKLEDVIAQWMDDNQDVWRPWVKDAMYNPGK